MSKMEIMQFLDKHPGSYFDVETIMKCVKCSNIQAVYRSLKGIIKRREYCMKVVIEKNRIRCVYSRIKEVLI